MTLVLPVLFEGGGLESTKLILMKGLESAKLILMKGSGISKANSDERVWNQQS
jgi:hypothetical protein